MARRLAAINQIKQRGVLSWAGRRREVVAPILLYVDTPHFIHRHETPSVYVCDVTVQRQVLSRLHSEQHVWEEM